MYTYTYYKIKINYLFYDFKILITSLFCSRDFICYIMVNHSKNMPFPYNILHC